jgi:hypothetical protein
VKHVARVGKEKLLDELDERIRVKWTLKKEGVRVWPNFLRLRVRVREEGLLKTAINLRVL